MDFENISSTFSPKSDLILAGIMKKNNLGERGDIAELILTKITMLFSRTEISEKEMIDSIQKELNLSQQTAKQIINELINDAIPTLWDKMPQEEREALLKKSEGKPAPVAKKPDFKDVEENAKFMKREGPPILKENTPGITEYTKQEPEIKKLETIPELETIPKKARKLPKKNVTKEQSLNSKGIDKYREQIK